MRIDTLFSWGRCCKRGPGLLFVLQLGAGYLFHNENNNKPTWDRRCFVATWAVWSVQACRGGGGGHHHHRLHMNLSAFLLPKLAMMT